jgi:hypothetical protein
MSPIVEMGHQPWGTMIAVVTEALKINRKWKAGEATYKRVGAGRRRVIVYAPSKKDRAASAFKRAFRSWNWTVVVAGAFMIALVLTSAMTGNSTA